MTDEELAQRCKELDMGTMTEEQLRSQRRIWESFEYTKYLEENNPVIEMAAHPECTAIQAGDFPASKRVSEMVDVFLKAYPTYILPEDKELHHPSYLARYQDIDGWLIEQCGGVVEFWALMVAAAKEWFPEKKKTKLYAAFCVGLECIDLSTWNGWAPIQPVLKEYYEWRYDKDM